MPRIFVSDSDLASYAISTIGVLLAVLYPIWAEAIMYKTKKRIGPRHANRRRYV